MRRSAWYAGFALVLVPACSGHPADPAPAGPTGTAAADPARFGTTIDNPYLPLVPGTRFRYEGETNEGHETDVVEVTRQTRRVMGVQTVVVRDTASRNGRVTEDTYDWYAQDRQGNVWYFGEATKSYDGGKVSTKGSWEAGKHGAQPGIVMRAAPRVGDRYRQEYLKGEAEDVAEVLRVDDKTTVPFGAFDHLVTTKDTSPLEPAVVEHKSYARGVGEVLEVTVKGGRDRMVLVAVTRP